jgi:ABC-2 type transport system ATP-binding protein
VTKLTGKADRLEMPANFAKSVILETQELTRRFDKFTAVDALNISVTSGEVFGLLGPNGAGKSTVIKMLTTLLPASAGRATIAGYDVTHQQDAVRKVIGYVPQALSADGSLTGYENLLIFAKLYDIPSKQRRERIRDVLAFMGLEEASDRLVRNYSGGMIRKLEIAQSILHRPQIMFLDEPFGFATSFKSGNPPNGVAHQQSDSIRLLVAKFGILWRNFVQITAQPYF